MGNNVRIKVVGTGPLAAQLSAALSGRGHETTGSAPYEALVFAPWDPALMVPRPLAELTDAEFDQNMQASSPFFAFLDSLFSALIFRFSSKVFDD